MATTVVVPTDDTFAEQLRRIEQANAAQAQENAQLRQQVADLNRVTAPLRPAQQQQRTDFNFADPTASVESVTRDIINREVAPHVNRALQSSFELQRAQARAIAAADPKYADVFTYFGGDVDAEVQASMGAAAQVIADYWKRAAAIVAFNKHDELAVKRRNAAPGFSERGGSGGQARVQPITELPDDMARQQRLLGNDPKDPKIIEFYRRAEERFADVS